jgi:hypothetical protein
LNALSNELFIVVLGLACAAMLAWGFCHLPGERWQFLACLPLGRQEDGGWRGLNLTWYGLLLANAQALAAALMLLLMAARGTAWWQSAALLAGLCALCLPASRVLAGLVEKKAHTFTVGGASLVGILAAPLLAWLGNRLAGDGAGQGVPFPLLATCAAMVTAYALGEGLGRLACVSFGCCYGRPLRDCPPWLARLFARAHFVFHGPTKKIAYASGLEGLPVIPVQALTALIYLAAALAGTYLFLRGSYAASLLVAGLTTQLWRAASEFLRADYRGGGRLSAYQVFALLAAGLILVLGWTLSGPGAGISGLSAPPTLTQGLAELWAPGPLLLLQAFWSIMFVFYGRSRVTSSSLSFFVAPERI